MSEHARDLISVVMPVRNAMPHLPAALQSILDQTHADIEVLAINDGSTDGSDSYLRSIDDDRLRLLDSGGRGLVSALNLGLEHARGAFVARHDADDLSDRFRIARQLEFFGHHPRVDLAASGAHFIDEESLPVWTDRTREAKRLHREAVCRGRLHRLLPLTCCIVHGSVMARTPVMRAVGGYRAEHQAAEDYDLWLRMLSHHQLAMMPDDLYFHRLHSQQVTEQRRDDCLRGTLAAKLDHLRAFAKRLPISARTLITGDGPGATLYRALCSQYDFAVSNARDRDGLVIAFAGAHEVRLPRTNASQIDLVIVTDYVDARRRVAELEAQPGWRAYGNFLIREQWW